MAAAMVLPAAEQKWCMGGTPPAYARGQVAPVQRVRLVEVVMGLEYFMFALALGAILLTDPRGPFGGA